MPSLRLLARRLERRRAWLISALLALLLALLHGGPLVEHVRTSLDPFAFADDVRVLIHPLYRVENAALLPRDPVADYYLASLPDGFRLLYRIFGPFVGVAATSKILPYLLTAATLALLGVGSFRFGGAAAAFGTLSLGLGSAYLLGRAVGGLPRGFALPLLAGGAVCLVFGRARALAALTVLAAALYPVAALALGVSLAGLLLLPESQRGCTARWSLRKRFVLVGLTALLAGLVLLPSARRLAAYGPPLTSADLGAYPEIGPGGRFDPVDRPPFPALPLAAQAPLVEALVGAEAPLVRATDARRFAAWLCPLFLAIAAVGWAVQARRRADAVRLAILPAAVVICHSASLALEPHLFLPQRHVAYAVPVIALIVVPGALAPLATSGRRWLRYAPAAFVPLLLALIGARGSGWTGITVRVPLAERPLYAAIARLPPDALIAGFPSETTDSIPYLARRSVLVARETHMPFQRGFAELMRVRMRALTSATFATTPDAVRALRDRFGVTHLLVDRRHFRSPPLYFAPFEAEARAAFERGRPRGFFLQRLAPALEHGDFALLELGGL